MAKVDKRVVDYIEKELRKGFSKELIKEAMLKAGYNPSHIDFHLNHIKKKKIKKAVFFTIVTAFFAFAFSFIIYTSFFDHYKKFNRLADEGNMLCDQGRYDEAMEKFDRLVKLNATSPKGFALKGYCLLKQNKYAEAIIELEKAGQINSLINNQNRNPNYRFALGKAYCSSGNYRKGILQLNRAIALNSSNKIYPQVLAECNLKLDGNETQVLQKK